MARDTAWNIVNTYGDLLAAALQCWFNGLPNSFGAFPPYSSIFFENQNGAPAYHFQTPYVGGDTLDQVIIACCERFGDGIGNIQQMLATPGVNTINGNFTSQGPGPLSRWTGPYLDFKKTALEQIIGVGASVSSAVVTSPAAPNGYTTDYTGIITIKYGASTFFTWDTYRLIDTSGTGAPGDTIAYQPGQLPLGVVPFVPLGITPLVAAVQEISSQDQTFSINQGAAAFSIKSRVSVP